MGLVFILAAGIAKRIGKTFHSFAFSEIKEEIDEAEEKENNPADQAKNAVSSEIKKRIKDVLLKLVKKIVAKLGVGIAASWEIVLAIIIIILIGFIIYAVSSFYGPFEGLVGVDIAKVEAIHRDEHAYSDFENTNRLRKAYYDNVSSSSFYQIFDLRNVEEKGWWRSFFSDYKSLSTVSDNRYMYSDANKNPLLGMFKAQTIGFTQTSESDQLNFKEYYRDYYNRERFFSLSSEFLVELNRVLYGELKEKDNIVYPEAFTKPVAFVYDYYRISKQTGERYVYTTQRVSKEDINDRFSPFYGKYWLEGLIHSTPSNIIKDYAVLNKNLYNLEDRRTDTNINIGNISEYAEISVSKTTDSGLDITRREKINLYWVLNEGSDGFFDTHMNSQLKESDIKNGNIKGPYTRLVLNNGEVSVDEGSLLEGEACVGEGGLIDVPGCVQINSNMNKLPLRHMQLVPLVDDNFDVAVDSRYLFNVSFVEYKGLNPSFRHFPEYYTGLDAFAERDANLDNFKACEEDKFEAELEEIINGELSYKDRSCSIIRGSFGAHEEALHNFRDFMAGADKIGNRLYEAEINAKGMFLLFYLYEHHLIETGVEGVEWEYRYHKLTDNDEKIALVNYIDKFGNNAILKSLWQSFRGDVYGPYKETGEAVQELEERVITGENTYYAPTSIVSGNTSLVNVFEEGAQYNENQWGWKIDVSCVRSDPGCLEKDNVVLKRVAGESSLEIPKYDDSKPNLDDYYYYEEDAHIDEHRAMVESLALRHNMEGVKQTKADKVTDFDYNREPSMAIRSGDVPTYGPRNFEFWWDEDGVTADTTNRPGEYPPFSNANQDYAWDFGAIVCRPEKNILNNTTSGIKCTPEGRVTYKTDKTDYLPLEVRSVRDYGLGTVLSYLRGIRVVFETGVFTDEIYDGDAVEAFFDSLGSDKNLEFANAKKGFYPRQILNDFPGLISEMKKTEINIEDLNTYSQALLSLQRESGVDDSASDIIERNINITNIGELKVGHQPEDVEAFTILRDGAPMENTFAYVPYYDRTGLEETADVLRALWHKDWSMDSARSQLQFLDPRMFYLLWFDNFEQTRWLTRDDKLFSFVTNDSIEEINNRWNMFSVEDLDSFDGLDPKKVSTNENLFGSAGKYMSPDSKVAFINNNRAYIDPLNLFSDAESFSIYLIEQAVSFLGTFKYTYEDKLKTIEGGINNKQLSSLAFADRYYYINNYIFNVPEITFSPEVFKTKQLEWRDRPYVLRDITPTQDEIDKKAQAHYDESIPEAVMSWVGSLYNTVTGQAQDPSTEVLDAKVALFPLEREIIVEYERYECPDINGSTPNQRIVEQKHHCTYETKTAQPVYLVRRKYISNTTLNYIYVMENTENTFSYKGTTYYMFESKCDITFFRRSRFDYDHGTSWNELAVSVDITYHCMNGVLEGDVCNISPSSEGVLTCRPGDNKNSAGTRCEEKTKEYSVEKKYVASIPTAINDFVISSPEDIRKLAEDIPQILIQKKVYEPLSGWDWGDHRFSQFGVDYSKLEESDNLAPDRFVNLRSMNTNLSDRKGYSITPEHLNARTQSGFPNDMYMDIEYKAGLAQLGGGLTTDNVSGVIDSCVSNNLYTPTTAVRLYAVTTDNEYSVRTMRNVFIAQGRNLTDEPDTVGLGLLYANREDFGYPIPLYRHFSGQKREIMPVETNTYFEGETFASWRNRLTQKMSEDSDVRLEEKINQDKLLAQTYLYSYIYNFETYLPLDLAKDSNLMSRGRSTLRTVDVSYNSNISLTSSYMNTIQNSVKKVWPNNIWIEERDIAYSSMSQIVSGIIETTLRYGPKRSIHIYNHHIANKNTHISLAEDELFVVMSSENLRTIQAGMEKSMLDTAFEEDDMKVGLRMSDDSYKEFYLLFVGPSLIFHDPYITGNFEQQTSTPIERLDRHTSIDYVTTRIEGLMGTHSFFDLPRVVYAYFFGEEFSSNFFVYADQDGLGVSWLHAGKEEIEVLLRRTLGNEYISTDTYELYPVYWIESVFSYVTNTQDRTYLLNKDLSSSSLVTGDYDRNLDFKRTHLRELLPDQDSLVILGRGIPGFGIERELSDTVYEDWFSGTKLDQLKIKVTDNVEHLPLVDSALVTALLVHEQKNGFGSISGTMGKDFETGFWTDTTLYNQSFSLAEDVNPSLSPADLFYGDLEFYFDARSFEFSAHGSCAGYVNNEHVIYPYCTRSENQELVVLDGYKYEIEGKTYINAALLNVEGFSLFGMDFFPEHVFGSHIDAIVRGMPMDIPIPNIRRMPSAYIRDAARYEWYGYRAPVKKYPGIKGIRLVEDMSYYVPFNFSFDFDIKNNSLSVSNVQSIMVLLDHYLSVYDNNAVKAIAAYYTGQAKVDSYISNHGESAWFQEFSKDNSIVSDILKYYNHEHRNIYHKLNHIGADSGADALNLERLYYEKNFNSIINSGVMLYSSDFLSNSDSISFFLANVGNFGKAFEDYSYMENHYDIMSFFSGGFDGFDSSFASWVGFSNPRIRQEGTFSWTLPRFTEEYRGVRPTHIAAHIPPLTQVMSPFNRPLIPERHVSSPLGNRYLFGGHEYHWGVDFSWEGIGGEFVYPIAPGEVSGSGFNHIAGNYIYIDHHVPKLNTIVVNDFNNNTRELEIIGIQSRYLHLLNKPGLNVGDRISFEDNRRPSIGQVGNTGRSTAPHLHLDIVLTIIDKETGKELRGNDWQRADALYWITTLWEESTEEYLME